MSKTNLEVAKEFEEWFQLNGYGRHGNDADLWRTGLRMAWEAATSRICADKDAEIAKLYASHEADGVALLNAHNAKRDAEEESLKIAQELDEANAVIAMQAEKIKKVISYNEDIRDGKINYRPDDHIQILDEALSASTESISAFRAKETEPLRREVAMLRYAIVDILAAERFSNRPPETVMEAEAKLDRIRKAAKHADEVIENTQAAAEAYDTELAARTLEDVSNWAIVRDYKINKVFLTAAAELRSQSAKKE